MWACVKYALLCWAQVCVRREAALLLCNGSYFISSSSKLRLQFSAFGFSMGKERAAQVSGKIPTLPAWRSLAGLLCNYVKMGGDDMLAIKYVFCPINVIFTWGGFRLPHPFFFCALSLSYSAVASWVECPGGTHQCPDEFILDDCFTATPLWFVTAARGQTRVCLSSEYWASNLGSWQILWKFVLKQLLKYFTISLFMSSGSFGEWEIRGRSGAACVSQHPC